MWTFIHLVVFVKEALFLIISLALAIVVALAAEDGSIAGVLTRITIVLVIIVSLCSHIVGCRG